MFLARAQDGISVLVKRDRTSAKNDRGLHLNASKLAASDLAVGKKGNLKHMKLVTI